MVSVKLNDENIKGSPFTWKVEKWSLVKFINDDVEKFNFSENRMAVEGACKGHDYEIRGSVTFSSGCHAWTAKAVQGGMYQVGVRDLKSGSRWVYSQHFEPGRICSLYLNIKKGTLIVQHLPSRKTETFNFESGVIGDIVPCFTIRGKSKLSLSFEN